MYDHDRTMALLLAFIAKQLTYFGFLLPTGYAGLDVEEWSDGCLKIEAVLMQVSPAYPISHGRFPRVAWPRVPVEA